MLAMLIYVYFKYYMTSCVNLPNMATLLLASRTSIYSGSYTTKDIWQNGKNLKPEYVYKA